MPRYTMMIDYRERRWYKVTAEDTEKAVEEMRKVGRGFPAKGPIIISEYRFHLVEILDENDRVIWQGRIGI